MPVCNGRRSQVLDVLAEVQFHEPRLCTDVMLQADIPEVLILVVRRYDLHWVAGVSANTVGAH